MFQCIASGKTPKNSLRVAGAVALFALALPGQGLELRDARVRATCSENAADLLCHYRYLGEGPLASVEMALGGQVLSRSNATAYPGPAATTAVLFLIDTSDPTRGASVRRSIEVVNQLAEKAKPHHRLGLGHFDSELYISAPLGSSYEDIRHGGEALIADGASSELYRSLVAAVKVISVYPASRRAIITLSAGVADDTAYFLDDVVNAATQNNIALVGVGIPESSAGRPHLQSLRRLANDTIAPFVEMRQGKLPASFVASPFASIDAGGAIRVPLTPRIRSGLTRAPLSLRLILRSGVSLNATGTGMILAKPSPSTPASDPNHRTAGAPSMSTIPHPLYWAYGAGGGLVLAAIVWSWIRRRAGKSNEDTQPGAVVQANESPIDEDLTLHDNARFPGDVTREDGSPPAGIFGYLEVHHPLFGGPPHHPITRAVFRIGRSSRNDLTFNDPSVSRHHSEIHMGRDGSFTVQDLGSMNGVYVNEKRVRTATLHEGDKLDLGDLSLTFTFLAPQATPHGAPQATPHGAPHATAEYSGKETLVLAPDFDSTGIDLDYTDKYSG